MFSMHQVVSFVLLALLSVAYSTAMRRVERLRRAVTKDWLPDMNGAWIFASILLLPPVLLAAALCVFYAAEWRSRTAVDDGRPWKYLYSAAGAIVSALTASAVFSDFGPIIGTLLALVTFTTVNISLISLAIILSREFFKLKMLRNPLAHTVELATHLIGVALGATMAWHQPIAVLVLPILIAVHLASAHDAVADTGSYDPATRLWSEEAWQFRAEELIHTKMMVTVMVFGGGDTTSKAVLADVARPWLLPSAILGNYGAQIVSISATGSAAVGQMAMDNVARALEQSGADYFLGGRTARNEDASEMVAHALADLMAARDRAEFTNPW